MMGFDMSFEIFFASAFWVVGLLITEYLIYRSMRYSVRLFELLFLAIIVWPIILIYLISKFKFDEDIEF